MRAEDFNDHCSSSRLSLRILFGHRGMAYETTESPPVGQPVFKQVGDCRHCPFRRHPVHLLPEPDQGQRQLAAFRSCAPQGGFSFYIKKTSPSRDDPGQRYFSVGSCRRPFVFCVYRCYLLDGPRHFWWLACGRLTLLL